MHIYLTEQETKLTKKSKQLIYLDKDEKEIFNTPLIYILSIHVFGNIQVTSQTLGMIAYQNIPIAFYTQNGHYRYSLTPPLLKNFNLRRLQYNIFQKDEHAFKIAKKTISVKIQNQIAVLERLRKRQKIPISKNEIALKAMVKSTGNVTSPEKLLGFEGIAAKKYWEDINTYISSDLKFEKRSKRPPKNEANALISYVYSLLYTHINGLIQGYAYEPFPGFFHKPKNGRYNLALDVMEPFRPICDRFTIMLLNKNIIKAEDFQTKNGGYYLTEDGRKKIITRFHNFANTKINYENLKNDYSLVETIRISVESITGLLLHNKDIYYPILKS